MTTPHLTDPPGGPGPGWSGAGGGDRPTEPPTTEPPTTGNADRPAAGPDGPGGAAGFAPGEGAGANGLDGPGSGPGGPGGQGGQGGPGDGTRGGNVDPAGPDGSEGRAGRDGSDGPGGGWPAGGVPPAVLTEALFARAPVGFALYDRGGRYVRVNDVMARLNGYAAGEHVGHSMPELLGDIGREMENLVRRVVTTGEPVLDVEVSFATGGPERTQTWALSWYPALDPRLGPVGVAAVATDVTARKDAEAELARGEARYRSLVDADLLDVVHANAEGALDVDMPRWRGLTGQRRSDIAGLGWLDAVHAEDREGVKTAWRSATGSGGPFDAEYRLVGLDGAERVIATRALPVADRSGPVEWVGTSRDVSELRQTDAAVEAASAQARSATDRAERLTELAGALSRAVTVDEVVAVVLDAGGRALGAAGRGIALVDDGRDRLRFRALLGYPEKIAARWMEIGLGAVNPAAEAVRGGRALFLSGREELTGRWPVPELSAAVNAGAEHAWAVLPLATTDLPFGVVAFGFTDVRTFPAADRRYLSALAEVCAQALERATLFERVIAEAAAGRRAEEAARVAEAAARDAGRRLDLLSRATAAVTTGADPERALTALAEVVVAEFADTCAIYLVDQSPGAQSPEAQSSGVQAPEDQAPEDQAPEDQAPEAAPPGGDDEGVAVLRRLAGAVRPGATAFPRAVVERWPAPSPVFQAAARDVGRAAPLDGATWFPSAEVERWLARAGAQSVAAVPLPRGGRAVGVMVVTAAGDQPPFTDADLVFLAELAARAAVAVGHAELEQRGQDTAVGLQWDLLPHELSAPAGVEVAARYVPGRGTGGAAGEVGGDWYDVIDLGADRLALVVGDVSGRGVRAAALMGQLRAATRTCARLGLSPAQVLGALDALVGESGDGQLATCAYAVLEPESGWLTLADAGHPPPLVVAPDGLVSRLYMQVGAPLGLGNADVREYRARLTGGSLLAFFTDGLVRGRDTDVDAGVSDLAAVLARADGPLAAAADQVLDSLARADGPDDDVVLLLARLTGPDDADAGPWATEVAAGAAELRAARAHARGVLEEWGVEPRAVDAAVLVLSEFVAAALVGETVRAASSGGASTGGASTGGRSLGAVAGVGRTGVEVRLRRVADRLLVEVVDPGGRLPTGRAPSGPALGTRPGEAGEPLGSGGSGGVVGPTGADLIRLLTLRWGGRSVGTGTVAWAEIHTARP